MTALEQAARWIGQARRMVFLGGAGVSVPSGIPDFRSAGGIGGDFETILSHDYFMERPEAFYAFYRSHMVYPEAKPNLAHRTLAGWERAGLLRAVITQNIDGLHQAAGSRRVLELHGSVLRNHCMACGQAYGLERILEGEGMPRCRCGGVIKPDVVLYGEPLEPDTWQAAEEAVAEADLMLVAGMSLRVYPAAGLLQRMGQGRLVLINREPTAMDRLCDCVIHGDLQDAFAYLPQAVGGANHGGEKNEA